MADRRSGVSSSSAERRRGRECHGASSCAPRGGAEIGDAGEGVGGGRGAREPGRSEGAREGGGDDGPTGHGPRASSGTASGGDENGTEAPRASVPSASASALFGSTTAASGGSGSGADGAARPRGRGALADAGSSPCGRTIGAPPRCFGLSMASCCTSQRRRSAARSCARASARRSQRAGLPDLSSFRSAPPVSSPANSPAMSSPARVLVSKMASWARKPALGSACGRTALMVAMAVWRSTPRRATRWAATIATLRLRPAEQCTSTPPRASSALSMKASAAGSSESRSDDGSSHSGRHRYRSRRRRVPGGEGAGAHAAEAPEGAGGAGDTGELPARAKGEEEGERGAEGDEGDVDDGDDDGRGRGRDEARCASDGAAPELGDDRSTTSRARLASAASRVESASDSTRPSARDFRHLACSSRGSASPAGERKSTRPRRNVPPPRPSWKQGTMGDALSTCEMPARRSAERSRAAPTPPTKTPGTTSTGSASARCRERRAASASTAA